MGLISPLYRLLNRVTPEHCTIFPPVARPREDVLTFVPPRCIYVTISSRATKSVHPAVVLRRTHIAHAQYQPYPHSVHNKKATCGKKLCAGAPGTREKETKRKDLQLIFYQDSTPFNMACISSLASILSREYYCIMQCIFVQKNLR